jgi:hypothetical protein
MKTSVVKKRTRDGKYKEMVDGLMALESNEALQVEITERKEYDKITNGMRHYVKRLGGMLRTCFVGDKLFLMWVEYPGAKGLTAAKKDVNNVPKNIKLQ